MARAQMFLAMPLQHMQSPATVPATNLGLGGLAIAELAGPQSNPEGAVLCQVPSAGRACWQAEHGRCAWRVRFPASSQHCRACSAPEYLVLAAALYQQWVQRPH